MEDQVAHEQAKHQQRMARLNRIKELAEEEGDENMISRAWELLEKEQKWFDKKIQRMEQKRQRIQELIEQETAETEPVETEAKEAEGQTEQKSAAE